MKNNKGFMLAEVVVTSTIVLTALIGLYVTFNKLYNNYNIRMTYYDIDGIYAIKNMTNILLDTGELNDIIKDFTTSSNKSIIENSTCHYGNKEGSNKCSALQSEYYIQNIYITTYDKQAINNLQTKVLRQTFIDYLDYISKYYDLNETYISQANYIPSDDDEYTNKYNYLFIIEYKNDDKYYYSSLGLG